MRRVQVYDTLRRETRLFVPIAAPRVGLFVCGLTPYDAAHLGHARFAIVFDVVARSLRRWGYRVFYVQNVTNLDDRLIERGAREGVDPMVLADRNFRRWEAAMGRLGIDSVNYYPYATDYIAEIIEQIGELVDRGFAYPSDGSVYYEVAKFPAYGRLSGQKPEALRPGARVEVDARKRAPEDFVVWKGATPGEPSWPSPWGPGRPGWHIEDTAITARLLGARYDLHGGGVDLKFPHHEAEIAQAEAATGQSPLVNYWMHNGLLTLKGEKMSKSLGNVVGLDATVDAFGGDVVRFYFLNAHYRSPLDFVPGKSLEEAREAYRTLQGPADRLETARAGAVPDPGVELPEDVAVAAETEVEKLDATLAEDFQTREAIARLFAWGRTVGPWLERLPELGADSLDALAGPYDWAREVLGLLTPPVPRGGSEELDGSVRAAIDARARARGRGDFAEADRIREELAKAGIVLEDHGGATRWHRRTGSPA